MASIGQNSEINKKLKAAIRAKLEELQVPLDDELPEYIMVMMANKKSKVQMKNDLNLFLGSTSGKFCDWLFDLFDRLSNAKPEIPDEKEAKKDAPVEGSSREKDKAKEVKKESHRRSADDEREEKERREQKRISEREKEKAREHERTREKEREREKERVKEEERRKADREKERMRELREERKREKEREDRKRISSHSNSHNHGDNDRRERARKDVKLRSRSRSRSKTWSDDEFEQKIAQRSAPPPRKTVSSLVTRALREPSPEPEPVKVSSQVVVKRKVKSIGDEKTMKSRSNNMFMKAISEASASAGYGAPTAKPVVLSPVKKPVQAAARLPLKDRLAGMRRKRGVEESASEHEDAADAEDEEEYDSDTIVNCNSGKSSAAGTKITVTLKGAKEHIRQLVEKNKEKEKALLKRRKHDVDAGSVVVAVAVEAKKRPTITAPEEKAPDSTVAVERKSQKWDGQINIDDDDEDGIDMTSDDEEAEIDALVASANTVSCRTFSHSVDDEMLPPTHQLSRGASYTGYSPTPSMQQLAQQAPIYVPTPVTMPSLQNQQFENEAPVHHLKNHSGKMSTERCHFWPNCRQGDNCIYHHPITTCTNFPNCSFGNRCLYIHPPCKFGRQCTNTSCTFTHGGKVLVPMTTAANNHHHSAATAAPKTHSSPKKILPDVPLAPEPIPIETSLSSSIPCRFAAACTRVGCIYQHPKECRFGAGCRNPRCYFYHKPAAVAPSSAAFASTAVSAPIASAFKWKARPAQAAPATTTALPGIKEEAGTPTIGGTA